VTEQQPTARERLHRLLDAYARRDIPIADFCSSFETIYNLELDVHELTAPEARAFRAVFERVVWYSPFPEERAAIPNYVGEDEVAASVAEAERILHREGGSAD
jgi:hypothetical protein